MKQFLVTYVNHKQGIFHVGMFNEFLSSGKPNLGYTLRAQHAKASWAKKNQVSGANTFDSGFHLALMNTEKKDWVSSIYDFYEDVDSAQLGRLEVIADLTKQGFRCLTLRTSKNERIDGDQGNRGWGGPLKYRRAALGNNLTMLKIYDMVERIAEGMNLDEQTLAEAKVHVYDYMVGKHWESGKYKYKSDIWNYLNTLKNNGVD